MAYWNDRAAFINGKGNLSLGLGVDDGAAHATYPWLKNDVWIPVNAALLVGTTLPALTRVSAGVFKRSLVASTTHNVLIPLPSPQRPNISSTQLGNAPHGVLVKSVALFYRVNTADLTSIAITAQTIAHAAAAAIYTGTDLPGTMSGGTLTQAANIYAAVLTLTTPTFVNTADMEVNGDATIVTPASSVVDLLGASWRIAYGIY